MTATTKDREGQRSPSELEAYKGASGWRYYKDTFIMADGAGVIKPAVIGTGASLAKLLGVLDNSVDLSGGDAVGSSNILLEIYKTGEFTFEAQGTGVSADIGKQGFIMDDQTVGVSAGFPRLLAGEITGMPTTGKYRVRINQAVGAVAQTYLSGALTTLPAGASGFQVLGTDNAGGITWYRLGTSTAVL